MERNNYYVALQQRLGDSNIGGLRRMLYEILNEECNSVIDKNKNPSDYIEALLHGIESFYIPLDVADDLFISYLEEVSRWLSEIIAYGYGLDVFSELASAFDDPLCVTREAREYVINLLLFDIINVGLEEIPNG